MGGSENAKSSGIIRHFSDGARKNRVLPITTTPGPEGKSRLKTSECLERELPRKLKNSWIESGVDLAKVGVVEIERVRHREIGVVENVECFKP